MRYRIFRLQSRKYGGQTRPFWPIVERILVFGLEVLDIGSIRFVYGDSHRGVWLSAISWLAKRFLIQIVLRYVGVLFPSSSPL